MAKTINVGVVGSRSRSNPEDKKIIKRILEQRIAKGNSLSLVSGGCYKGADRFAEELAQELSLEIKIYPVSPPPNCNRWQYAQLAYERNTLIANDCDILLALWDGQSGGTRDTILKVRKLNKPCLIL